MNDEEPEDVDVEADEGNEESVPTPIEKSNHRQVQLGDITLTLD